MPPANQLAGDDALVAVVIAHHVGWRFQPPLGESKRLIVFGCSH
jgi:hypothetical protein